MDLERMRRMCHRDQWRTEDLDWSQPPPELPREREEAVVQSFTDMAGIERLAGALFEAERQKATDPVLRDIFASFVADELRHAEVAARLARHYDVHRYRDYTQNPHLQRFRPAFEALVGLLSPEVANVYITTGEVLLDVALLRALDDYVGDAMSHAAMSLINRDESRHIAVDFHMVEHYSSEAHRAEVARRPRPPLREALPRNIRAGWALARVMWHARPFFDAVFFAPMDRTDPTGRRMTEAFRRLQVVARRPEVRRRPFIGFMMAVQDAYEHPIFGRVFGRLLLRVLGLDPRVARRLFTEADLVRARGMSMDDLAAETLAAKAL